MTSIIIPCKGRLNHLRKSLRNLLRLRGNYEVVIVDFNCPQKTYDILHRKYSSYINSGYLKVIKTDVEENHWNLSESRNWGYKHCSGDYLLFLDADTILKGDFIENTLSLVDETHFATGTTGEPKYWCCGCMMVKRTHFEKVKGYNEELKGWGYEDFDMYGRLNDLGLTRNTFNESLIHNLAHSDSQRNIYHSGDTGTTNSQNHIIATQRFKGIDGKLIKYKTK